MPDWMLIAIRALSTLMFLFVLTRILGKKQISQLTFFEYVIGITLGDLAGNISTDVEANYLHGVIAILVWVLVPLVLEIFTLKSKTLRGWFEGNGRVMIQDGQILEDNLRKERYTGDELLEQLRTKGVFRVADVEFAMLESSGDLSILLKSENQPLTPKHMGMKLVNEKPTQAVMMDGVIQNEPLAIAGKSRGWLQAELDKLGVAKENVFLAQVDTNGELMVDLYNDTLQVPANAERPMVLACLKKCEADLELYSLTTENAEAKQMYENCSIQLTQLIQQVHTILRA